MRRSPEAKPRSRPFSRHVLQHRGLLWAVVPGRALLLPQRGQGQGPQRS